MMRASSHANDKLTDHPRNPAVPYCNAVKAREVVNTGPVLDWGWLKIDRELHNRYGEVETRIELRLPVKRRKFFDYAWDAYSFGRPTLFVAFGKVPLAKGGWHARGAIIYTDVVHSYYDESAI